MFNRHDRTRSRYNAAALACVAFKDIAAIADDLIYLQHFFFVNLPKYVLVPASEQQYVRGRVARVLDRAAVLSCSWDHEQRDWTNEMEDAG